MFKTSVLKINFLTFSLATILIIYFQINFSLLFTLFYEIIWKDIWKTPLWNDFWDMYWFFNEICFSFFKTFHWCLVLTFTGVYKILTFRCRIMFLSFKMIVIGLIFSINWFCSSSSLDGGCCQKQLESPEINFHKFYLFSSA